MFLRLGHGSRLAEHLAEHVETRQPRLVLGVRSGLCTTILILAGAAQPGAAGQCPWPAASPYLLTRNESCMMAPLFKRRSPTFGRDRGSPWANASGSTVTPIARATAPSRFFPKTTTASRSESAIRATKTRLSPSSSRPESRRQPPVPRSLWRRAPASPTWIRVGVVGVRILPRAAVRA